MARHPHLPIKLEEPNKRFVKQARKLPPQVQDNLSDTIKELATNTLGKNRRFKLVAGYDDVFSIRLDRKYRVAIKILDAGIGRLPIVGKHDVAYESLNRSR